MFDALAFGREAFGAIEPVHGAVEGLVRPPQAWGHQVGIVEVGQRCARMGGAGIKDGLRQRL